MEGDSEKEAESEEEAENEGDSNSQSASGGERGLTLHTSCTSSIH